MCSTGTVQCQSPGSCTTARLSNAHSELPDLSPHPSHTNMLLVFSQCCMCGGHTTGPGLLQYRCCDSMRTCAYASQALNPFAQNVGAGLTANDNTRVGITIPASHQREPQAPSTGSRPRHRPPLKHPSSALPPSCAALSARSGPPAHADPAGVTQTQP